MFHVLAFTIIMISQLLQVSYILLLVWTRLKGTM